MTSDEEAGAVEEKVILSLMSEDEEEKETEAGVAEVEDDASDLGASSTRYLDTMGLLDGDVSILT